MTQRPLFRAVYFPNNTNPDGFVDHCSITHPDCGDATPFKGTLIRDALDRVVLEWCKERGNRYPKKIVSIEGLRTLLRQGKYALVHPDCPLLEDSTVTERNRLCPYEGVKEGLLHMFDELQVPFHVKIYYWTSQGFKFRVESDDSRHVFRLP